MSETPYEQSITRAITRRLAEIKGLTHDEVVEELIEAITERERTVANLRSALEIAEQRLLVFRRQQIDAVSAQLAKLEAL